MTDQKTLDELIKVADDTDIKRQHWTHQFNSQRIGFVNKDIVAQYKIAKKENEQAIRAYHLALQDFTCNTAPPSIG